VSSTLIEVARGLSARFSEIGENEQPEIYVLAQTSKAVRVRIILRVANPAKEEEAKSEFRKRLATLNWAGPPSPPQ
jgi:Ser/Thr protein kinase RdoA (MazF antagonist)